MSVNLKLEIRRSDDTVLWAVGGLVAVLVLGSLTRLFEQQVPN